MRTRTIKTTLKQRFDMKWMPEPFSGCWIWIGAIRMPARNGKLSYGSQVHQYKHLLAHRLSWILHKGEIPNGLDVLHRCDTSLCVNPDHLFLGTQKDNVDDMIRKGRKVIARGERAGSSKLTENDVHQIRALYIRGKAPHKSEHGLSGLARRFNVTKQCIASIVKRQWWRHISDEAYEVSDAVGKQVLEVLADGR